MNVISQLAGSVIGVRVAANNKFDRLKELMESGKDKGYVLYEDVNDLLQEDGRAGEIDDLFADLETSGVEILEEPKLEKGDEPEEFSDLDFPSDVSDKTTDPVRMYLREMGTVPLLTREGEIELAKRIERGQTSVMKSLSRSPLVTRELLHLSGEVAQGFQTELLEATVVVRVERERGHRLHAQEAQPLAIGDDDGYTGLRPRCGYPRGELAPRPPQPDQGPAGRALSRQPPHQPCEGFAL